MLLESILLAGILLFEIPTGVLGDKIGRKWSLVCGAFLGLIAWIPWFLAGGFLLFALSFFLSGVGIAFQSGSDQALIYDELKRQGKESNMQRMIGRYFGAMTLGTAVAALIGGYLASTQNLPIFYFLYLFNVIAQLIGFVLLLTVREPAMTAEGMARSHSQQSAMFLFISGLRTLLVHTKLKRIFLLSLITLPFPFVLIYLFQPYFVISGVAPVWFGIAVFLASILSANAKIFSYKIEKLFGVEKGALIVTLLPGVLWLCMAVVFHPVFSVLLYILTDTASSVRDPVFSDYLNRHIESYNRATVLSILSMTTSLYSLIMRPIIGFLVDKDIHYGFIAIGLLIICGAVYFRITQNDVEKI